MSFYRQLVRIFFILVVAAAPALANQRVSGYCQAGAQTVTIGGLSATAKVQGSFPACTVTVYNTGTLTKATIYSDNLVSPTPLANPFVANSDGSWNFYPSNGRYDIVLSGGGLASPVTLADVTSFDVTVPFTSINLNGNTLTAASGTATINIPNVTDTLVNLTSTQTLLNKSLTAPAIAGGTLSGAFTNSGTITGGTYSNLTFTGTIAGTPTLSGLWTFSSGISAAGITGIGNTGTLTPGTGILSSANVWTSAQTAISVNGVVNATFYSGADIFAKVNAAGAACGWACEVVVPPGTYSASTSVNIPLYADGKFGLTFISAQIAYSGTPCAIDMNEVAGVATASNLEISGYGSSLTGTSAGSCAFHILPTNGIKIHGFLVTGFTNGACFQADGAIVTDIYNNHCEGNKYGWYAQTVGCRTTAPYDCSAANTGAGFARYDANANDVHNNVLVGTNWGVFEDGTSNGSTLGNKYRNNDFEGSGSAGSGFGAMKLANNSYALSIRDNYFENAPHFIVCGTGTKICDATSIAGNHFTTPNTAGKTIELVNATNANIVGNDELNPIGPGACFIDLTTATNNHYGINKVSSTNQFCNAGVGGRPTDAASIWYDVLNSNRLNIQSAQIGQGTAGLTILHAGNTTTFIPGSTGFAFANHANSLLNFNCDDSGNCASRGSLSATGFIGTGSPKIASGSASNTDVSGELVFAAATTGTYTFVNTYSSHPECWTEWQANPGTTLKWVTYTGTTSFTINTSAAFTGTISYGCVGRN